MFSVRRRMPAYLPHRTFCQMASSINQMLERPLSWGLQEQKALIASDATSNAARPLEFEPPPSGNTDRMNLRSWGEFFVKRCNVTATQAEDRYLLSTLTAAYSCSLTVQYALETLGMAEDVEETDPLPLRIHFIGAAASHEEALLRGGYFSELAELLPNVTATRGIELHFVGPELTVVIGAPGTKVDAAGRMTALLTQDMWENTITRREGDASTPNEDDLPDLAVAFNSGCGVDQDMWTSVIQRLQGKVPLLLTCMDTHDTALDYRFLQGTGSRFLVNPAPNPFGSRLLEVREEKRVMTSNQFLMVVI